MTQSRLYRRVTSGVAATATALVTVALLAAVALAGCQKKGTGKKPDRAVPVKVEPAVSRTVVSQVFLTGEILADVEVRVFSLVPERILELKFEEGDRVKKDQVLAVIKGGALWQAVRQSKAGLGAAETQEKLAKIELERTRKLYQTDTVAIAALQRAEAQWNVAQAQVKQMQAAVGQTYATIANVVIRAPIDGVVGQRFLSRGDLAGPQLPLCTIIQTDDVRVKAMATEFDLVKLKKDQKVQVTVPAFPGQSWPGQVDYIAPVIDRMTRSAWVTVLVKNPGGKLRPGMFADMTVTTGERSGVVMTLARAVLRRINEEGRVEHFAFLARDGVAKLQLVSIGLRQGKWIEVSRGLSVGDPVVVLGNAKLREGAKLRVVKEGGAASVAQTPPGRRTARPDAQVTSPPARPEPAPAPRARPAREPAPRARPARDTAPAAPERARGAAR